MKKPLVDIIIPAYGDFEATKDCVENVLKYLDDTQNLVLINDKSPEEKITKYLRKIKEENTNITLIEHKKNLGFVQTANEGMSVSHENDVILLNNDTIVTTSWVKKLRERACVRDNVATVTPFSNSATIFSYPKIDEYSELPKGLSAEEVNELFEIADDHAVVEVPTGHGFCMYVTRKAINAVGLFDVETFGEGYGEENDFCQRAKLVGFINIACPNCFIYHKDGASFGSGEKREKIRHSAFEKVLKKHPRFLKEIEDFEISDPFRTVRAAVDVARFRQSEKPAMLFVQHNWGGGVENHVKEASVAASENGWNDLVLEPYSSGVLLFSYSYPNIKLTFIGNKWYERLLEILKSLNVCHVHFHHLVEVSAEVKNLTKDLSVKYDFTIHDYFSVCPRINLLKPGFIYCGATTKESECNACLGCKNVISGWRTEYKALLDGARMVFAPSEAARNIINKYYKNLKIKVIEHSYPGYQKEVQSRDTSQLGNKINVAVIGAISYIKGLGILEECVRYSTENNLPINWILIGSAENESLLSNVKIAGRYTDRQDLGRLISENEINSVLFPSVWPETFSYVISEAWEYGLPVVTSELGAQGERVKKIGAGWVVAPFTSENICKKIMAIKNNRDELREKIKKISVFRPASDFSWRKYYGDLVMVKQDVKTLSKEVKEIIEIASFLGKLPEIEKRVRNAEHKNYINEQKIEVLTERCDLISGSRVWKLRNKIAKNLGRGEI